VHEIYMVVVSLVFLCCVCKR